MSALMIQPYETPTNDSAAIDDAFAARALASARARWGLSGREAQVLVHLAEGDANKDIAAKLSCALRTVEAHVTSILVKAGSKLVATWVYDNSSHNPAMTVRSPSTPAIANGCLSDLRHS